MKNGFNRLKGVALGGAMGLGLLAGTGRAASISTAVTINNSLASHASWNNIRNNQGSTFTTSQGIALSGSTPAFNISDANIVTTLNSAPNHRSDLFDGGMALWVGGNYFVNPDNTVDLTGTTLTTDVVTNIVAGIDAQIEYYFDPTRPVVRALYTLTNTSATAIDTPVLVLGNLGTDQNTTVQDTSNGDQIVDDADYWVVSDDNNGWDPVFTISSHSAGAAVFPTAGAKAGEVTSGRTDNFAFRYDLSIPAGATYRLMLFGEMNGTVAEATAEAVDFESLASADAAGLLSGLTVEQQNTIVNYGGVDTTTTKKGSGALDLFGLLGLFSVLGLSRLFRFTRKSRQ